MPKSGGRRRVDPNASGDGPLGGNFSFDEDPIRESADLRSLSNDRPMPSSVYSSPVWGKERLLNENVQIQERDQQDSCCSRDTE